MFITYRMSKFELVYDYVEEKSDRNVDGTAFRRG